MKVLLIFAGMSLVSCVRPYHDCSQVDPVVIRTTYVDCLKNSNDSVLTNHEVSCRISAQKLHCPLSNEFHKSNAK